jgi:DNA-binding HxlR family transcriptional regulator
LNSPDGQDGGEWSRQRAGGLDRAVDRHHEIGKPCLTKPCLTMAYRQVRPFAEVSAMSADDCPVDEIIVERRSECPVTTAIGIIAGKWKPTILCEIREGPRRFGDFRRDIPGISEKVLSQHLRDLEADGIVARREFHEGAVLATEYGFTEYGRTLIPALNALAEWGTKHQCRG